MRIVKRLFIVWVLGLVAFYFFGFPLLMDFVQTKARTDAYNQCIVQMNQQGLIGNAITPDQAGDYCHCVADPLTFTRDDLGDVLQKKTPARITQQAKELVEQCNVSLQHIMNGGYAQPAPPPQPYVQPTPSEQPPPPISHTLPSPVESAPLMEPPIATPPAEEVQPNGVRVIRL